MHINISPEQGRKLLTVVSFIFLVWSLFAGFFAGRDLARSRATFKQTEKILDGFALFYDNQSRYPSIEEFSSEDYLGVYLEKFPGLSFTHKKWCQEKPVFDSRGGERFEYSFCLPRNWRGFERGWHTVTERQGL